MTHIPEILLATSITIFAVLFLRELALILMDKSDDCAAGVSLGQASPAEAASQPAPAPVPRNHFVSACMYCHTVRSAPGAPVCPGDTLRLSHGICDDCLATHHPEVAGGSDQRSAVSGQPALA